MRRWTGLILMAVAATLTGCASMGGGKVWTWNQRQALSRSGGDIAMTALLDQGVDKAEAVEVCRSIAEYLESGAVSKEVFQKYVYKLVPVAYADWVDALFLVIGNVELEEQIPAEVRTALVSFLRDGALYGAGLYKDEHKPAEEGR